MSLIACPACGKQVSKRAPACPQCGHPIAGPAPTVAPQQIVVEQPRSRGWGIGGCLLLLLLLGGGAIVLFQTDIGKQLFDAGQKLADSQRILGKWEGKGTFDSLEFFSNGDLRIYAALVTHKGKWQILPGQRLQMETDGLLWGKNKMEWNYEFSGNRLLLKGLNGSLSLEYERK